VKAENPFVLVARSGRNPATVPALVRLAELLGLPVVRSAKRAYHCFPLNHPLYQNITSLRDADLILALDVDVPWAIGPDAPPDDAFVAIVDVEPSKRRIPTMEFTADLRLTADSFSTIEMLEAEANRLISAADKRRFESRAARWAERSEKRRRAVAEDARSRATETPIDPKWLSYQIGRAFDDDGIMFDDTVATNRLVDYLHCARPGCYFYNPGSSGGWAPGAALGAKLAEPKRDVVTVTGDGFYMFGNPVHALWSAVHYSAPFLSAVYQNRSYSTGTLRLANVYPDGDGAKGGFEGGYFDPPIDFAKEAQAAGAYGENVTDPHEVEPALQRGLRSIRGGVPAVISVWLPRLLQND
jgi:acetolactate synthase-1/2/3 large subunit